MDDDRIEQALRQGPPDEPTYEPGRFARTAGLGRPTPARRGRRIWSGFGGTVRLAATGVVVALIVAGLVVVRSGNLSVSPSPTPGPVGGNDLLARVRSSGVLRVAIVPDYPNVQLAGGAYDGIDIDVAREIAARLGVRAEIVPVNPADLVAGGWSGRWDVVVGLTITTSAQRSLEIGQPYRFQPALVAVRSDLPIATVADLAGHTVCVGADPAVAQWLNGSLDVVSATPIAPAPAGVLRTNTGSDSACLATAGQPSWDAFVGDRQLAADYASLVGVRVLGQPAFTEEGAVAADRSGPSPTSLLAAIDQVIAAMRADGTLTSISKRRFGGVDVQSRRDVSLRLQSGDRQARNHSALLGALPSPSCLSVLGLAISPCKCARPRSACLSILGAPYRQVASRRSQSPSPAGSGQDRRRAGQRRLPRGPRPVPSHPVSRGSGSDRADARPGVPDAPALLWRTSLGGGVAASPIVVNGQVIVGANDGQLYALDFNTGAVLWTFQTGGGFTRPAAVAGGLVFVAGTDHVLHAVDLSTHRERWQFTGASTNADPDGRRPARSHWLGRSRCRGARPGDRDRALAGAGRGLSIDSRRGRRHRLCRRRSRWPGLRDRHPLRPGPVALPVRGQPASSRRRCSMGRSM